MQSLGLDSSGWSCLLWCLTHSHHAYYHVTALLSKYSKFGQVLRFWNLSPWALPEDEFQMWRQWHLVRAEALRWWPLLLLGMRGLVHPPVLRQRTGICPRAPALMATMATLGGAVTNVFRVRIRMSCSVVPCLFSSWYALQCQFVKLLLAMLKQGVLGSCGFSSSPVETYLQGPTWYKSGFLWFCLLSPTGCMRLRAKSGQRAPRKDRGCRTPRQIVSIGMTELERRTSCCSTINCCSSSMFHSTLPFFIIVNCHCLATLTGWLMPPLVCSELAGCQLLGCFSLSRVTVPAYFSPTLCGSFFWLFWHGSQLFTQAR